MLDTRAPGLVVGKLINSINWGENSFWRGDLAAYFRELGLAKDDRILSQYIEYR